MTRIAVLIRALCPDGVEYVKLKDVARISVGGDLPENYIKGQKVPTEQYPYPIYSNGTEDGALYGFTDNYKIEKEAVTISARGTIGYHTVRAGKFTPIVRLITMIADENKITTKFLHYALYVAGIGGVTTGIPSLTVPMLEKFSIPLPPLPVQQEIVSILDNFTELTAELTTELTAELTARKKQYEYYKKSLLSQSSTAFVTKLGEVATLKTGSKPKEIFEEKDKFDYINAGTSNSGYTRAFNCEGDTVTTPSRGQGGIGFVGYQKNSFWLGPLCYRIKSKDTNILLNRYLYHYLSCFKDKILQYKKEGGTPSVNSSDLVNIAIDIPSIDEQKRIIAILDRFDTLYNDLNSGLSAEIAARCKQYEYYRDNLLTFKEASA